MKKNAMSNAAKPFTNILQKNDSVIYIFCQFQVTMGSEILLLEHWFFIEVLETIFDFILP